MAVARIEISMTYGGSELEVTDAVEEMLANARQRALTAEAAYPGTADEETPFAEAVLLENDLGERVDQRVGAWHVDPEADDADDWGIVDDRLPGDDL